MTNEIENPWEGMNGPNYYTQEDESIINAFNDKTQLAFEKYCDNGNPHFIDKNLFPEPYMGNPKANIVLLYSNPGISSDKSEEQEHRNENFRNTLIKNLIHEEVEFPYYYLNPHFEETAGAKWIIKRTDEIVKTLEVEMKDKKKVLKLLSNNLFTLQLHPFHSREFQFIQKPFSKEAYTMRLFMDAIYRVKNQGALMICTRSYTEWNNAYQKETGSKENLEDITNFIRTKSARSAYLTKGNLGEDKFELLIEKLIQSLPKSL